LNAAQVAGTRGHGARFKEARGPKPLVNAHGVHCIFTNSAITNLSGFLLGSPQIEVTGVARRRDNHASLVGRAIEGGANVRFAVGQ